MRDDLLEDGCCSVVIAVVDVKVRTQRVTGAAIRVRWLEQEGGEIILLRILLRSSVF